MKNFISKLFKKNREEESHGISTERDLEELLNTGVLAPFECIDVQAVHTGRVVMKLAAGDEVFAPSGEWMQVPGTVLYEITRERNHKLIKAHYNGTVEKVHTEFDGQFVEAGETLMTIKHPLKKKEVIEQLLKDVLFFFPAPETASYFFSVDVQRQVDRKGARVVTIEPGDEVLTMSLMKRDAPVYYDGEKGVIHSVYFKQGVTVERGEPLIGVCSHDKLPVIEKIITKVRADWYRSNR